MGRFITRFYCHSSFPRSALSPVCAVFRHEGLRLSIQGYINLDVALGFGAVKWLHLRQNGRNDLP
ncbi:hypothetical protein CBUVS42_C05770 [Coxiella burnetii]|nr:hypothetical protein CBUVS42_C05770 [Coxiella burnetii]